MKQSTKDTIDGYVKHRWRPGSFVQAVLENDLMSAMGQADEQNRRDIFEICMYVYNEIPGSCHGSPERVRTWLKGKPEGDEE
jgi:hypothetical protein